MKNRPRLHALELQALRTIRKFAMLEHGDHIVVAASGGADSTALLLCLHDLAPGINLELTVAHLNHGIRGREADEDEDFIRALSMKLGWPFVSEAADLKVLAVAGKRNLEELAREVRYEFLQRAAGRAGANKIATGHNSNDQAETILFRLLRGSGPEGLSGIHAVVDGRIIRPLIECSRRQILDFLSERGITCREDSTNRDLHNQRNRIRHELVPYLESHCNPRLIEALAREAEIAHAANDFLEHHARMEFEKLRASRPDGVALQTRQIIQLHPALRRQVVRIALRETFGSLRGIGTVHIEELLRLCGPGKSGRRIELPGGIRAWRDLDTLELGAGAPTPVFQFHYELAWPGRCRVPEAGLEFLATLQEHPGSAGQISHDAFACALLDPDRLPSTLTIRSRLPGDRYGGENHRKVKKMLLAARIPFSERAKLPVVAAGQVVAWVPGFKPARFFGAKSNSSRSMLLQAMRLPSREG